MKREAPRTNKTVPELTSDPARGQRAKERASRERGFGYSNPREAGWSTSFTPCVTNRCCWRNIT